MPLRTFLLLLFCSFHGYHHAQPLLTTGVEPVLGDTIEYGYSESFIEPGNSGPNQFWSLNGTGGSGTTICIPSTGTPFQGTFPGATYCWKTTVSGQPPSYEYFSKSGNTVRYHGLGRLGGEVVQFAPLWPRQYPMQYDSSQINVFTATVKSNGKTTFSKFLVNRHYDAYGKMNWRGQIKDNAMRLKISVLHIDSLPAANGTYVRTISQQEWYQYFLPDVRGYIAFTRRVLETRLTINAQGDTLQKLVLPPVSQTEFRYNFDLVDTETPQNEDAGLDFSLLENPVADRLIIQWGQPEIASAVTLSIFSSDYKLMHQEVANTSLQRYELDVSLLPAGHYLLRVFDGSRVGAKIWVKQ